MLMFLKTFPHLPDFDSLLIRDPSQSFMLVQWVPWSTKILCRRYQKVSMRMVIYQIRTNDFDLFRKHQKYVFSNIQILAIGDTIIIFLAVADIFLDFHFLRFGLISPLCWKYEKCIYGAGKCQYWKVSKRIIIQQIMINDFNLFRMHQKYVFSIIQILVIGVTMTRM